MAQLYVYSNQPELVLPELNTNFTRGTYCLINRAYEFIADDPDRITVGEILAIQDNYSVTVKIYKDDHAITIDLTNDQ